MSDNRQLWCILLGIIASIVAIVVVGNVVHGIGKPPGRVVEITLYDGTVERHAREDFTINLTQGIVEFKTTGRVIWDIKEFKYINAEEN